MLIFFMQNRIEPEYILFPYTTLFRSGLHGGGGDVERLEQVGTDDEEDDHHHREDDLDMLDHPVRGPRSEEHTSELQSRLHLVCRLLLEKKNKHGLVLFSHFAYCRMRN